MLKTPATGAIYLFCFARSALLTAVEGNGVDGKNPLFLLVWRDIVAVVSCLSQEECLGYCAEDRMLDLAWVGPRARRHQEVVERVVRHSPALPARLGTIFCSIQSLENRLNEHHDAIGLFLDKVSYKDEWSVKGFLCRSKAEEEYFSSTLSSRSEQLSSSPGTRYLQERQIRASGAEALKSSLREVREILTSDLGRIAEEMYVHKVLPREAVCGGRDMIFNWAFLVWRNAVTDFRMRICLANKQFEANGLLLELSGPWPPYSFCPSLRKETPP